MICPEYLPSPQADLLNVVRQSTPVCRLSLIFCGGCSRYGNYRDCVYFHFSVTCIFYEYDMTSILRCLEVSILWNVQSDIIQERSDLFRSFIKYLNLNALI